MHQSSESENETVKKRISILDLNFSAEKPKPLTIKENLSSDFKTIFHNQLSPTAAKIYDSDSFDFEGGSTERHQRDL